MKSLSSSILPRAPIVGLALIAVLIVVNVVVSEWNTRRLIRNERRVFHSQEMLTALEEVLARVTEAETGERGFLITGDTAYLESYESAVGRTGETLRRLESSVTGNPRRAQVAMLQDRVRVRFHELANAIAAHQAEGFDAAKHAVSTNQGRRLMNEMRQLVGEMQAQEQEALALRSAESQRSAQITMVGELIGSLLGIGTVGMAFFLFRRDFANRQRAETAIRQLAAIVEFSDDAVVSKSLDGDIESWNAGAQRLFGYTAEETVGQPVTMLCPPERAIEVEETLERVRRGLHVDHFETVRLRKDGRRINISLSVSPIKDAAGNVVGASAISRDITERKLLQREVLEIATREQRRIGQDLHDGTGQELTGLAMLSQRLAEELSSASLAQAGSAAKIVDGLEQALGNVRALSKGLVPVEVEAEGLMIALSELARRTSDLHAVSCRFECAEPVFMLDNQTSTNLYRLSQEAVTNALRHGQARNIVVSLAAEGEMVTLAITDDGRGFPALPQRQAGTGLRIMQCRAELIGAKLTVAPVEPHGTRVACTLSSRPSAQRADAEPISQLA